MLLKKLSITLIIVKYLNLIATHIHVHTQDTTLLSYKCRVVVYSNIINIVINIAFSEKEGAMATFYLENITYNSNASIYLFRSL